MGVVPAKEWHEITVVYNSGATITFVTDDFKWERSPAGRESVTWGEIKRGSPKPMKFGIDDVTAIWARKL